MAAGLAFVDMAAEMFGAAYCYCAECFSLFREKRMCCFEFLSVFPEYFSEVMLGLHGLILL